MKYLSINSIAKEEYISPRCGVFSIDMESVIANNSGTPGGDDDYNDYEDD